MKTSKEIEQELKELQKQLELVKQEEEKAAAEVMPDFLVNFDPINVKDVLDFFEDESNCERFLKSGQKYIYRRDFCEMYREPTPIEWGDWSIVTIDQDGGGEGSGEHWHCVFKVEKNGKLVGFYYIPGYYASYEGTEIEWDSIYEVEPFEKVVQDWRAK